MNPRLIQVIFDPALKVSAACQHGGDMLGRAADDTRIPVKGGQVSMEIIYTFFIQNILKTYKTLVLPL